MSTRLTLQNILRGLIAVFFFVLFTRIFAGTLNGNTFLWSLLLGGTTTVITLMISSLFTLYYSRKKR